MNKGIFLLIGLLCSGLGEANANETKLLIQGCAEIDAIYNRRGEKHLLAGLNTSVAEALRAGYCKGVLEQYRRGKPCYRTDWVEQARIIGEASESKRASMAQLLSRSCG